MESSRQLPPSYLFTSSSLTLVKSFISLSLSYTGYKFTPFNRACKKLLAHTYYLSNSIMQEYPVLSVFHVHDWTTLDHFAYINLSRLIRPILSQPKEYVILDFFDFYLFTGGDIEHLVLPFHNTWCLSRKSFTQILEFHSQRTQAIKVMQTKILDGL